MYDMEIHDIDEIDELFFTKELPQTLHELKAKRIIPFKIQQRQIQDLELDQLFLTKSIQKLNHVVKQMEQDLLETSDKKFYWEKKAQGELKDDNWVVISNGKILIQTLSEEEALGVVSKQNSFCVMLRVNHEDDVIEVSEVECEYRNSAYHVTADIINTETKRQMSLQFKVDTGANVVALPHSSLTELQVHSNVKQRFSFAHSQDSYERLVYLLSFELDGKRTDLVKCIESPRPLLGMPVLRGYKLVMQNGTSMQIIAL